MNSETSKPVDDELLMAFVDGELTSEEQSQIEQAMNEDPQLAARVEVLAKTRRLAQQAFSDVLDEPVPDKLLEMLPPAADDNKVVDLASHRGRISAYMLTGIAASLALVVGLLVGSQFPEEHIDMHALALADAGYINSGNPLHTALEEMPSHSRYTTEFGDVIVPLLTFKANDGRYCREFEINAERAVSIGVACRLNDVWQLEVLLAGDARPSGVNDYQPASGYSEAALNTVLDSLWQGDAYDLNEEKRLTRQQWQQ